MSIERADNYYLTLLNELRKYPNETEWLEFKHNRAVADEIGEYISALSNGAALHGKNSAYMIWGVDDKTHEIMGTTFQPHALKVGEEELENWLLRLLDPKIEFYFHTIETEKGTVVILEISSAFRHPVRFKNMEYIRVGSYKKKLKDYPEKERKLWRIFDNVPFEKQIAAELSEESELLTLLDYPSYFELLNIPLPEGRAGIIHALETDELIVKEANGKWNITNLGAILFAKDLGAFKGLNRKAIRVVQYESSNKIKTVREHVETKGYASGFENVIGFINSILPANEVIEQAL